MNGWIIPPFEETCTEGAGRIIGADGKLYRCEGTDDLAPECRVSFCPAPKRDVLWAEDVRAAEEAPDPVMDAYRKELRGRLSQKRYLHSFRVSKIARALAELNAYDPRKAEIAGLLHDVAKERTNEENAALIRSRHVAAASFELRYHYLTHAYAGAVILQEEFGISDEEILSAVRSHSGKPDMNTPEKILYLADHLDKCNAFGINMNFLLDGCSPDDAILRLSTEINKYYLNTGREADPVTENTINYMLRQRFAALPAGEDKSFLSEQLFDRALRMQMQNGLGTKSVPNAREIRDYAAKDGKKIAAGLLFRSGSLGGMSDEDAGKLWDRGVRTVVDLRMPEEIRSAPDRAVGRFRQAFCPLPAIEPSEFLNEMAEKYFLTESGREKTFYLGEYLSGIDMQGLYETVLTDEASLVSLRRLFALLAAQDTGGILFHCTGGKDRTGVVAALLMAALGIGREDIRTEYYASAVTSFAVTESLTQALRKQGYGAAVIDEARSFSGIGMNIAEGVFARVLREYGTLSAYLSEALGLNEAAILRLKEKYLTAGNDHDR